VREKERDRDGETDSAHLSERAPLQLSPPVGLELQLWRGESRERVKSKAAE